MRRANLIIAVMLLLANVYFIRESIWHFNHFGGPYYTIIPFLISLFINSMIFSAVLTFHKSFRANKLLLGIHIIGLVLILLYSYVEIAVYLDR
jgi:hypothetical protein